MSWSEKIQNDFLITCGDGKTYKVNWLGANKSVDYNISEFEFPELAGTLVQRGTPKGRRYTIEIFFQGENNIEDSQAFETSANDPRAWTVSHPLYGTIIAQPVSLAFDDSKHNVTKITGQLVETLTQDKPKNTVVPADKVTSDKLDLDEVVAYSFANDIPEPDTNVINDLTDKTSTVYNEGKKSVKTTLDAEEYFNAFNTANAAILEATEFPLEAMRAIQAVINAPALFADGVKNRITTLVNTFTKLRDSIANIVGKNEKKVYESTGGTLVSAMALAAVTDIDYRNAREVLSVIDQITEAYDTFVEDLDGLQSDNASSPESYIPDANSLIGLNNIINFTISNLYDVALDSKQERSIILEEDSNIFLLTHRFYGLQEDDSSIDQFMDQNEIGLNEMLGIRKGRRIIYYV
jgi:hypothetical protein